MDCSYCNIDVSLRSRHRHPFRNTRA